MKTTRLLLLLLLCSAQLLAQDLGPTRLGLRGGYQAGFAAFKLPSSQATNLHHGGYAGIFLKIPFDNHLFFKPVMDVAYRGMDVKEPVANQFSRINELQWRVAPLLQIDFTYPATGKGTWFVHFGPSIGFGLSGQQTKQSGSNQPESRSLRYGYQAYGRYDASAHVGLGYEGAGGMQLHVDYNHGLSNMINTELGPSLKYRSVSLGLALSVGGKKGR
ncbi:MAG TPA: porin family protein [Lacibacter sp.]|mgnify:CR=1 FL=1|nr:porin family protein [Lacibacter sp.]HMO90029.1 porin family protein [Lacibacter sp.]HMP87893.1 porin family protein [Lacibacter sp.]